MFNVTIDFNALPITNALKRQQETLTVELMKAVQQTVATSLRQVKGEILPKRTGLLRRSYLANKAGSLSYIIRPNAMGEDLKYADYVEFGRPGFSAKKAKALVFSNRDDGVTLVTKLQRYGAAKAARNAGQGKGSRKYAGMKMSDIADELGLVFRKSVGPAKAQNNIKNYLPRIDRMLKDNIDQACKKAVSQ